jgi:hypothetical protein
VAGSPSSLQKCFIAQVLDDGTSFTSFILSFPWESQHECLHAKYLKPASPTDNQNIVYIMGQLKDTNAWR